MIHSGNKITQCIQQGLINIDPFDEKNLKAASYTFHLGSVLKDGTPIPEEGYELQPGQFVAGTVQEKLSLNDTVACFLSVRGSCAQMGLNALNSDLFVEPGWSGHLSLAMTNTSDAPIQLIPGMKIVKGIFMHVEN